VVYYIFIVSISKLICREFSMARTVRDRHCIVSALLQGADGLAINRRVAAAVAKSCRMLATLNDATQLNVQSGYISSFSSSSTPLKPTTL